MNAPITPPAAVPPYRHTPLFPLGPDKTPYRKLDIGGIKVEKVMGQDMLVVGHEAMRALK
jgi:fumarate hydratase class I